ncbi:MAG: sulfatase [Planctomycetota bacterium]
MFRPNHLPTLRNFLGAALLALPMAACGSGEAGDSENNPGQETTQSGDSGSKTAEKKQRPVILISIDSLRADFTTPYGHVPRYAPEEITTPFLQSVADNGVLFENTSAVAPWTLPSHISMLTGMAPVEHGVRSRKFSLHKDIELVSNVFRRNGYHTGGFFTAPFLHPAWGFKRGFDVYVPAADYLGSVENGEILIAQGKSPEVVELHSKSHTDSRTGEQAVDRALRWLERDEKYEESFFLFVHLWDPHYDYFPPAEYRERFLPFESSIVGDELMVPDQIPTEEQLEHLKALYEAEIRYTDDQIARLYAQLEEWGIADDVILAIVSDHGDEFLEHGNRGHHLTLMEEVIHVPMMLQAPGLVEPNQNVKATVSITDLSPTLLDLAGLPAWEDRSGRSMRPLWEGEDVDREVSIDLLRPARKMQLQGYRKGLWKGIQDVSKNLFLIYDLESDPGEFDPEVTNISADHPVAKAALDFLTRLSEMQHRVHLVKEAAVITNLLSQVGYVED